MNLIKNKLRVSHFPQVGTCKKSFEVEVKDEQEAYKIMTVLAAQHLWLEKNRIIPNYSNAIFLEMLNPSSNEWEDYYNDDEEMEWDEFVETYLTNKKQPA